MYTKVTGKPPKVHTTRLFAHHSILSFKIGVDERDREAHSLRFEALNGCVASNRGDEVISTTLNTEASQ